MDLRPILRMALSLLRGAIPAMTPTHPTGCTRFDRCINALNRLPRPVFALATPALFAYAMADPEGFSTRMRALALVPDPLWWLLGAVVTFYFGAREAHYRRERAPGAPPALPNPGLGEWRAASDPSLL